MESMPTYVITICNNNICKQSQHMPIYKIGGARKVFRNCPESTSVIFRSCKKWRPVRSSKGKECDLLTGQASAGKRCRFLRNVSYDNSKKNFRLPSFSSFAETSSYLSSCQLIILQAPTVIEGQNSRYFPKRLFFAFF